MDFRRQAVHVLISIFQKRIGQSFCGMQWVFLHRQGIGLGDLQGLSQSYDSILASYYIYISIIYLHYVFISIRYHLKICKKVLSVHILEQPFFYSSISTLFSIIPIVLQKYISTIYLPYLYISLLYYFYSILCLNISKYFNWKYVPLF